MSRLEQIALYALLTSLTALSLDSVLPALDDMTTSLPSTTGLRAQHIVSLFVLGMALGELGIGPLSDAMGRKPALLLGLGIYGVGSILACFAASLELLIVARILQGIGVAGPKIATRALIRDQFQGTEMARIMSLMFSLFILVPMLAPALGLGIVHFWHWRGIFGLFLMIAGIAALWLVLRQKETLPPERRLPLRPLSLARNLSRIIRHPRVTLLTLTAGLVFGAQLLYLSTAADIFASSYGVTTLFPAYFAALSISFAIAALLNARLVTRVGMERMTYSALIGMTVSGAALLIAQTNMDALPFGLFLGGCFAIFFCIGVVFGNLNALAMLPLASMAGLGAAFIAAGSSAVSVLVSVGFGHFHDGTPGTLSLAFPVTGLLALAATWLALTGPSAEITPD